MDFDHNICRIYKNGGTTIDNDGLKECIINAKQRTNQVKSLVNEALWLSKKKKGVGFAKYVYPVLSSFS